MTTDNRFCHLICRMSRKSNMSCSIYCIGGYIGHLYCTLFCYLIPAARSRFVVTGIRYFIPAAWHEIARQNGGEREKNRKRYGDDLYPSSRPGVFPLTPFSPFFVYFLGQSLPNPVRRSRPVFPAVVSSRPLLCIQPTKLEN